MADFGEAAECSFTPIVGGESLKDRQYSEVVVFWGILLWLVFVRISSPLLATCQSIQHALRPWVGVVSGVMCILHGLSSHPSRTVPRPVMGFDFFSIVSGDR